MRVNKAPKHLLASATSLPTPFHFWFSGKATMQRFSEAENTVTVPTLQGCTPPHPIDGEGFLTTTLSPGLRAEDCTSLISWVLEALEAHSSLPTWSSTQSLSPGQRQKVQACEFEFLGLVTTSTKCCPVKSLTMFRRTADETRGRSKTLDSKPNRGGVWNRSQTWQFNELYWGCTSRFLELVVPRGLLLGECRHLPRAQGGV